MKKKKKRPRDMTNEEAMRHLFKAKGHAIVKKHLAKFDKVSSTRKG
jgi:hypothetical protein